MTIRDMISPRLMWCLCIACAMHINGITVTSHQPGTLPALIKDPGQVVTLSVTGTVDATDIYFISSSMPALQQLDLSGASVAAYNGPALHPAHQGTLPANAIPPYAFMECTAGDIRIPADTREIGRGAFAGCGITGIELPEGLTQIGEHAFQSSALTAITIPPSVTYIGPGAFRNCLHLAAATINARATELADHTFAGCGSLQAVTLPGSLTSIGHNAFEGSGLTALDLSECTALTWISRWAFAGCPQLGTVIMPTSVTTIGTGAFMGDKSLTSVILSDNLCRLPALMLYGTGSLTSVRIPAATDSIGTLAMGQMTALASVDASAPRSVPDLEQDVWAGTPVSGINLYVPMRLINQYRTADQWRDFIIEGVSGTIPVTSGPADNIRITRDGATLHIEAGAVINRIRLIDCTGRMLAEHRPGTTFHDMDIDRLPRSVYIVQLQLDGHAESSVKIQI